MRLRPFQFAGWTFVLSLAAMIFERLHLLAFDIFEALPTNLSLVERLPIQLYNWVLRVAPLAILLSALLPFATASAWLIARLWWRPSRTLGEHRVLALERFGAGALLAPLVPLAFYLGSFTVALTGVGAGVMLLFSAGWLQVLALQDKRCSEHKARVSGVHLALVFMLLSPIGGAFLFAAAASAWVLWSTRVEPLAE